LVFVDAGSDASEASVAAVGSDVTIAPGGLISGAAGGDITLGLWVTAASLPGLSIRTETFTFPPSL
jgi:hypothetical protein